MDNEIKLCEILNFDTSIPENIIFELQMYSEYRVENEHKGSQILQKYYVPKCEYEFYKNWEKESLSSLLKSKVNVVLINNIARRHRLKVQKLT